MATGLAAVIPAKRLSEAKSRLAEALTPGDRRALSLEMLRAVAGALQELGAFSAWAVIGADPAAREVAEALGGCFITEEASGLNVALQQARAWALDRAAGGLLVIPSDVPLIRPVDISELLDLGRAADVVIAPSRDGGTNALLLRPLDAIPFRFGRRSAAYHRFEAERRRLRVAIVHNERLAFDVDTPQDYAAYQARVLAAT